MGIVNNPLTFVGSSSIVFIDISSVGKGDSDVTVRMTYMAEGLSQWENHHCAAAGKDVAKGHFLKVGLTNMR